MESAKDFIQTQKQLLEQKINVEPLSLGYVVYAFQRFELPDRIVKFGYLEARLVPNAFPANERFRNTHIAYLAD